MTVPATEGGFVAGIADAAAAGSLTSTTGTTFTVVPQPSTIAAPPARTYTEEDLQRVRTQEKDKLYDTIEGLKGRVAQIDAAEQARAEAETARVAAVAESDRLAREADLSAKELVEQRTAEILARLEEESNARKQAEALLVQEQNFQQLQAYRSAAVAANAENIIPELIDLVGGSNSAEIDASIAGLVQRSAAILGSVQAATQSARQDLVGSKVTLPPGGPLDTNLGTTQFSPEQVAAMSANDYAQNRTRLLGAAAQAGGKGIFG